MIEQTDDTIKRHIFLCATPTKPKCHTAGRGAETVRKVAHESLNIHLAQEGWHRAHDDGARAEGLDGEAEFGQFGGAPSQAFGLAGIEFDNLRYEKPLARDTRSGELLFYALVNQALVRRVLINQHQPGRARQGTSTSKLWPVCQNPQVSNILLRKHEGQSKNLNLY